MGDCRRKQKISSCCRPRVSPLVKGFIRTAENNPKSPHAFSAFNLIEGLSAELHGSSPVLDPRRWPMAATEQVHEAARTLLQRDSRRLEQTL